MSTKKIDYKAVLADLKAQRDKIDKAIIGIQTMMGLEVSETESHHFETNGARETGSIKIRSDSFFNMSTVDAARIYLQMVKDPQTGRQIAIALKKGGMKSLAKNLTNNVNAILKRAEHSTGEFTRVNYKDWGLSEWYKGKRKNSGASE